MHSPLRWRMTVEHHILRLGLKGDGVAEGPVYAARVLPGEVITGDVTDARIEKPKIVRPSGDRVKPACPHYNACGGCQFQHASDGFVARWKQDVVEAALAAQGLEARVEVVQTSPPNSRRRATLAGRRLKSGPVVGFHATRSDTVTEVPECRVLSPAILAARPALEAITSLAGSRRGELSFAVTETEKGLDCAITGGPDLDPKLQQALPQFARSFARITWNGEPVFADPMPQISFGTAPVKPPPGAFLQATVEGQARLTEAVMAATEGAKTVADLFAGCGTFALPLATRAAVHAVEGDAGLLAALDDGARHAEGLKPVTTETRDLFRRPLLPDELARFDAVVIDPPRAGAQAQMEALAEAKVPRIAMVSCNPATFARDAKMLADAGYMIENLKVIDQFRWSSHVELVAALRLPHMAGE